MDRFIFHLPKSFSETIYTYMQRIMTEQTAEKAPQEFP